MAKVKTPKKEKIVDLKPKAEKITDEQLKKVQSLVNTINRAQLEIGMLESRKHSMLHEVQMIQDQLSILQREFEEEYGTFDINVQDGKINYKEDVKADKKD
jgi:FtsZ-binding cell division protein ZapB